MEEPEETAPAGSWATRCDNRTAAADANGLALLQQACWARFLQQLNDLMT